MEGIRTKGKPALNGRPLVPRTRSESQYKSTSKERKLLNAHTNRRNKV